MQLKEDVSDQNTLIIKSLTNDNDVTIKLFQVKAQGCKSSLPNLLTATGPLLQEKIYCRPHAFLPKLNAN